MVTWMFLWHGMKQFLSPHFHRFIEISGHLIKPPDGCYSKILHNSEAFLNNHLNEITQLESMLSEMLKIGVSDPGEHASWATQGGQLAKVRSMG